MTNIPEWQARAAEKRAARDALIPQGWRLRAKDLLTVEEGGLVDVMDVPRLSGILSARELVITETDAPTLMDKMLGREFTSYEVTLAFCKRAAIAQQVTNCLHEILFDAALERASQIDTAYTNTGTPAGPLHGLPVSLKDCFNVEGVDSTIGFVAYTNQPMAKAQESEMTKLMRESGAVIYCKTAVPTAMMMTETYNNVNGYTTNPYNRHLTSGGSSGGEASLLAMRGSPLGVGTDIGGSIRIPASTTALYALKPSLGRFPTYGVRSGLPGQEAIKSINGPLSPSLDSLELWCKTVVDSEPWDRDPNMMAIPWRDIQLPVRLSFGIVYDDGVCLPTPPVTRALRLTAQALIAAGHEVIEWKAPFAEEGYALAMRLFFADGGVTMAKQIELSGEDWPLGLQPFQDAYEAGRSSPAPAVEDYWKTQAARLVFVRKALDLWMSSKDFTSTGRAIDGLISPTTAFPASVKYKVVNVPYTVLYNVTDQAAAVFPAAVFDPELDVADKEYKPRNPTEKAVWDSYDPTKLVGAPVGLQIIGRRLEEEKVLAMVGVIRDALAA